MLVNINGVVSKNVKSLSTFSCTQPNLRGVKDFPALILDRYSGITGLKRSV